MNGPGQLISEQVFREAKRSICVKVVCSVAYTKTYEHGSLAGVWSSQSTVGE